MRPEHVQKLLRTRPFRPFRLYLTNGRQIDVRHPEMASLEENTVQVGVVGPMGADGPTIRPVAIPLDHVANLVPLERHVRK